MQQLWDWLDQMGWEVLVIWLIVSLLVGGLVGRVVSNVNPSDEEPL